MYLLDTNILSLFDPRRARHSPDLVDWMQRNDRILFMSVISLTEIESGILRRERETDSTRVVQLKAFRDGVIAAFKPRILDVNAESALEVARLSEATRAFAIELPDLIIAATAKVHGLMVLTANLRHFRPTGVACHDPSLSLPG